MSGGFRRTFTEPLGRIKDNSQKCGSFQVTIVGLTGNAEISFAEAAANSG